MDQAELLSITAELAEVSRLLDADDVPTTLGRYVGRVVRTVPGCDHAAITVLGDNGLETVAGNWEPFSYQDDIPAARLNPILEAATYREPRRLPDTQCEQRWPAFADQLVKAGYRSCMVTPLATATDPSAVFTLLSREPGAFGDETFDMVLLLALHAGPVFDNASLYSDCRALVEHLRASLRTRSLIGRAQGLLMQRDGMDSDEAFAALRNASQQHNIKLRDLAGALVDAHDHGNVETVLEKYGLTQLA